MPTQRWVAISPESYAGRKVGDGHCVAFVQQASRIGTTDTWRRGDRVRGGDWAPGTVIATFHDSGEYYENDMSGRSHAAILIDVKDAGLLVWDQWVGHVVAQRLIAFRGAGGSNKVNDGDHFYTVVTRTLPADV